MQHRVLRSVFLTAFGLIGSGTAVAQVVGVAYARPLDPVVAGRCFPADLNDAGQVVGTTFWVDGSGLSRSVGFRTEANGSGVMPIGSDWFDSRAIDINANGEVLGQGTSAEGIEAALLTDAAGQTRVLSFGADHVVAAINDFGAVAGVRYRAGRQSQLFVGHVDGTRVRYLATPGTGVAPIALTNDGRVVGEIQFPASKPSAVYSRPFLTGPDARGVVVVRLPSQFSRVYVTGANEHGQLTGTAVQNQNGTREQFVADGNTGKVRSLGTLFNRPGGISEAGDINDLGYAVGVSSKGEKFNYIPVTITDPKGVMRDLNRMIVNLPEGVYLSWSPVINNRNQVAAGATDGLCYLVCATPDCSE